MASKRAAAKMLRNAAKFLETHKWGQGYLYHHGAYCAMGAINKSNGGTPSDIPDEKLWTRHIAVRAVARTVCWSSVTFWNDYPGRTKEEVIKAFREAARALEHGMQVY